MICWSPCVKCSYEDVAKLTCDSVTQDVYKADICVDDQFMFLRRFMFSPPKCKAILDSMADPLNYALSKRIPFYTSSEWNYRLWKSKGFNVQGIERRPIKVYEEFLDMKKDIEFIVVGASRFFDRKNLYLAHEVMTELGVRKKSIIVGKIDPSPGLRLVHGQLKPIPPFRVDYLPFTQSRKELHMLMARAKYYLALSVVEGVGLPPIEAMQYGTIPIYVDAHGFHENLRGIPVEPSRHYVKVISDYPFHIWEVEKQDILNAIKK